MIARRAGTTSSTGACGVRTTIGDASSGSQRADRVVQPEPALVDEHHRRRGGDRLADRRDPEDRVAGHRRPVEAAGADDGDLQVVPLATAATAPGSLPVRTCRSSSSVSELEVMSVETAPGRRIHRWSDRSPTTVGALSRCYLARGPIGGQHGGAARPPRRTGAAAGGRRGPAREHASGARCRVVREHPEAVLGRPDGQVDEVAGVAAERGPEDVAQDALRFGGAVGDLQPHRGDHVREPGRVATRRPQVPVERGAGRRVVRRAGVVAGSDPAVGVGGEGAQPAGRPPAGVPEGRAGRPATAAGPGRPRRIGTSAPRRGCRRRRSQRGRTPARCPRRPGRRAAWPSS